MTEAGARDVGAGFRHRRHTRLLISALLLLHWGSVAAFLLPVDPASLEGVPAPVRVPLETVAVPVAYRAWPVARRWLDATATRQRWTLFAPDPADWSAEVEVAAYHLVSAPGEPVRWRSETHDMPGPASDPLPHWTEHRPFRLVFNLGFDGWGEFYRPILARRLCLEPGTDGRRPAGIALTSIWRPLDTPWRAEARAPARQRLGGYSCWELLGEPRPAALPPLANARAAETRSLPSSR